MADPERRKRRARQVVAEGGELGSRLPGPPWVLQSVDVDGEPYALWLVTLDSDRCCLVADCGPVVLSGEGRHLDAWIWRLKGVPSPQYKTELGFDPG